MQRKQERAKAEPQRQQQAEGQPESGGREFGNVIEPMQAQMASGNEGLTGDTEKKPAERQEARKRGKKAA